VGVPVDGNYEDGAKLSIITQPSNTIWVCDSDTSTNAGAPWVYQYTSNTHATQDLGSNITGPNAIKWYTTIPTFPMSADRHFDGRNYLFYDGHVKFQLNTSVKDWYLNHP
jgi:prepilin-type processing-associated H-X9-DG protein